MIIVLALFAFVLWLVTAAAHAPTGGALSLVVATGELSYVEGDD